MDTDSDDLNDDVELSLGTDLNNLGTDADGLTDRVKIVHGLDPLNPGDAAGDNDLDGPGDADEISLTLIFDLRPRTELTRPLK